MPRQKITMFLSQSTIDATNFALDSGARINLKTLAADYGVSPIVMRRALIAHYGTSITFKKKVGIVRTSPPPVGAFISDESEPYGYDDDDCAAQVEDM